MAQLAFGPPAFAPPAANGAPVVTFEVDGAFAAGTMSATAYQISLMSQQNAYAQGTFGVTVP